MHGLEVQHGEPCTRLPRGASVGENILNVVTSSVPLTYSRARRFIRVKPAHAPEPSAPQRSQCRSGHHRRGAPDTSAITGKSQALSRPPTPKAHGPMPASSHEHPTPCGAPGANLRRIDAPLLQQYSQGSQETAFEIAGSEPKRFEAQTSLQNSVYSQTSIKPREARLALWNKLLLQAGVQDPFAITPESVKMGASVLRAAGPMWTLPCKSSCAGAASKANY